MKEFGVCGRGGGHGSLDTGRNFVFQHAVDVVDLCAELIGHQSFTQRFYRIADAPSLEFLARTVTGIKIVADTDMFQVTAAAGMNKRGSAGLTDNGSRSLCCLIKRFRVVAVIRKIRLITVLEI